MNLKTFGKIASCSIALVLCAAPLFGADPEHPSASFKISEPTAIPGRILKPGTYTIRVQDHLSDRYIVRVENASGGDRTLFLGVAGKGESHGTQGPVRWTNPANDATYLRGWNFSSLPTPLEFAYPKNDAVAVAKANNAQVAAVDPESEGMVSKSDLTKSEMQIITLWLLSPTSVGPNEKAGIKAVRFQQVASITHKPVIARLPHTASLLPYAWLLGLFSLASAFGLRSVRLTASARR